MLWFIKRVMIIIGVKNIDVVLEMVMVLNRDWVLVNVKVVLRIVKIIIVFCLLFRVCGVSFSFLIMRCEVEVKVLFSVEIVEIRRFMSKSVKI